MTNDQLIQRVQDNLPEDLSLEEIELLRERMRHSPELRDVLAGHLYWEQFLNTGLARDMLSADQVVARYRAQRAGSRVRLWRFVGWPLLLLAAVGIAGFSVRAWNRAQLQQPPEPDAVPAQPLAASSPKPPEDAKPAAALPAATQPEAVTPAAEVDPLAQFSTDKPRPFSETCFEPLLRLETEADLARLKLLWQPVRGSMLLGRGKHDAAGVAISGKFELRTAWPPGQVLRLSPLDVDRLEFSFSSGRELVSLRLTDRPSPMWAAYCSPISTPRDSPPHELLAATDDDRYRRTMGGPIELRYQDGLIVLSRGDVLLLAAPLSAKPERISLEVSAHAALLGNLTFAPGERFPLTSADMPEAPKLAKPTSEPPFTAADFKGELPDGVTRTIGPDGACELSAHDNPKPAWISLAVDQPGARELVFHIEAATPGSGFVLLDGDDRSHEGIGFNSIRRTQQLAVGYARPSDRVADVREQKKGFMPLVSTPLWLRIVAGSSLKCWTSADGVHWASTLDGRPCDGRWQRIGMYCAGGKGTRRIRVAQLRSRTLPALASLAEKHAGRSFAAEPDSAAWLTTALKEQPAETQRHDWLTACAARTLSAGCERDVARALVAALLKSAATMPGSFNERCDLIDELALVSDGNDAAATRQVVEAYVALGRQRGEEKLWQPYSSIRRRLTESPPLLPTNTASLVEPLIRAEILELVFHDAWDQLAATCERIDFFDPPAKGPRAADRRQAGQLVDWAEALVHRNRPTKGDSTGAILPAWRHPLIEQLGKEGFNILTELDAALAGSSYQDACKLISSVTPREAIGLLPNSADPALLVSLPGAVALAMRDHPALEQTMQSEFAPLGQLRLRQATAADNVAGVEAVTIQFYGTTAARQAHVWLGDRALAAGDFAEAETHYRLAMETANDVAGAADTATAARLRLACAMQGRAEGERVEAPVKLGDELVSAANFEKMIDEMLARSAAERARDEDPQQAWRLLVSGQPEPAGYRARRVAAVNVLPTKQVVAEGVPWDPVASETVLALTAQAVIVSNPAEIAAYARTSGQPLWRIPGGAPPPRGDLWPPIAMRPTSLGSAVLVRRWHSGNTQLISIENGKIAWQTPPGVRVASDPVVLGDRVLAITSAVLPQEMLELSLTTFDSQSGQQLAQHPLAQFRDVWQHEMPCELVLDGDTLLMVGGGCVLGCTHDGEAKWLRRETWVGGVVDQRTWPRHYGAPLVAGQFACIAQPGVPSVSCVETSNGRLAWQRPLADLLRLIAIVPGKLLVQTAGGFSALSLEDGSTLWQHPAPLALDGWLAGQRSGLLYAERAERNNRQSRVRLVWIDTKTGRQQASTELANWQAEQAMLGPLAADGAQLWTLAGAGGREAARELLELVPSGSAADPSDDAWQDRWLGSR